MAAIRNLKKLVIDRSRWTTGVLCKEDGDGKANYCMMGFVGRAYGLTDDYMRGRGSLYSATHVGMPQWLSDKQETIINYNDDGKRADRLRALFKKNGVELKFVDKAEQSVEAVFEDDPPTPKVPAAMKLADLEDATPAEPFKKVGKKKVAHG